MVEYGQTYRNNFILIQSHHGKNIDFSPVFGPKKNWSRQRIHVSFHRVNWIESQGSNCGWARLKTLLRKLFWGILWKTIYIFKIRSKKLVSCHDRTRFVWRSSFVALFAQCSEVRCLGQTVWPGVIEWRGKCFVKFNRSFLAELLILLAVVDVFLNKVDELCSGSRLFTLLNFYKKRSATSRYHIVKRSNVCVGSRKIPLW